MKIQANFKPRVSCVKYNTSVMKEHEVLLFMEAALENAEPKEAIADMRMIDTLLYATLLHKVAGPLSSTTKAGHYRKGSDIYTTFNAIIDGRIDGNF
jgi:hypothetical protein